MIRAKFYDAIYTHTSGGVLCTLHSGITYPQNTDFARKRRFLEENYDWLRLSLMLEPRGYTNMYGVFLTPPSQPDTHGGMAFIDGTGFLGGCGHGTIGLSMAMVSCGLVPVTAPHTPVRLETMAGIVTANVEVDGDRVLSSEFENVPAFMVEQDLPIEVPGFGTMKADIAFGGNYFALVRWDRPDMRIDLENGNRFQKIGMAVKSALNEKLNFRHPTHSGVSGKIGLVTFYNDDTPTADIRNVHVLGNGQVARSPGGTGTSAMVTMLQARGQIRMNQAVTIEGLLGEGHYEGKAVRKTDLNGNPAMVTTVKGKANLLGYAKWLMDPQDPVGRGYVIS